jgi:hypothetical protein
VSGAGELAGSARVEWQSGSGCRRSAAPCRKGSLGSRSGWVGVGRRGGELVGRGVARRSTRGGDCGGTATPGRCEDQAGSRRVSLRAPRERLQLLGAADEDRTRLVAHHLSIVAAATGVSSGLLALSTIVRRRKAHLVGAAGHEPRRHGPPQPLIRCVVAAREPACHPARPSRPRPSSPAMSPNKPRWATSVAC